MSYSRWGLSNWYAFWRTPIAEDLDSQLLALWHCDNNGCHEWTYNVLCGANEEWLRSQYPQASDFDISEAVGIITRFKASAESNWSDMYADQLVRGKKGKLI